MSEFLDGRVTLLAGDCRDCIKTLADNSIDSVVCDPPYALVSISKRFGKSGRTDSTVSKSDAHQRFARGFMGKTWDNGEAAFAAEFWGEVLRVLKPGGHVIAFSGTRTYHRLACAVEDAGFEIRDQIGWAYGSGFPKSHNQKGDWEGWGTGTTGEAAWREGMRAVLIEREPEYQADIARRMELAEKPTKRSAVAKSKNKLQGAEGTPLFGDEAA